MLPDPWLEQAQPNNANTVRMLKGPLVEGRTAEVRGPLSYSRDWVYRQGKLDWCQFGEVIGFDTAVIGCTFCYSRVSHDTNEPPLPFCTSASTSTADLAESAVLR